MGAKMQRLEVVRGHSEFLWTPRDISGFQQGLKKAKDSGGYAPSFGLT